MSNSDHHLAGFIALALVMMLILSCSLFQISSTPAPSGTISGKVIYQDTKIADSLQPLPGVLVALCRISEESQPQGPPVAITAQGESICTLQSSPVVETNTDGTFVMQGVPLGTYLLLFHLRPDQLEMAPDEWDGVVLTDASVNEIELSVPPMMDSDFWETGGLIFGQVNLSVGQGARVSNGNVCSNKYGFCFSVRDELLHPVVDVEPNTIAEAEVVTYAKPIGLNHTLEAANLLPSPTPASTKPAPSKTPTSRPPTATSTPTPSPIPGLDEPIVIEGVPIKNYAGISEVTDISMTVLDAFTQKGLKSGETTIQPKQEGDIFLSVKFNFGGSMDASDWAISNIKVLCGKTTYKSNVYSIEFDAGLLVSYSLQYPIPSDTDFSTCSLQLPEGRDIPLGRFFSSTGQAPTPGSGGNPPSMTPAPAQEAGRIYEPDGGFSYVPPEGWVVSEVPDFEYRVASGSQVGGFIPNLYFFVNQSHSGSLDEYVTESLTHYSATMNDLEIISQADFLTDKGERGVKVIMESTKQNWRLHLSEYFFAAGAYKFVATYTRLSNQGNNNDPLVDQSMQTFQPDPSLGGSPNPPEQTGEAALIEDDFGVSLALVPAGPFQMGSQDGEAEERPVHQVYLDAFYIDVYEVTNELFARFLNEMGNQVQDGETWLEAGSEYVRIIQRDGKWRPFAGNANHPVVMVSWYGARAFCDWRGARLPTEAEWEKAARGGLGGALYPWGNAEPIYAFDAENGAQFGDRGFTTVPVGSFSPNGYGLFDMAGNVYEWVADWYASDYYSHSPSENPLGPSKSDSRVVRGGSWVNGPYELRVSYRGWGYMTAKFSNFGFRCAISP